MLSHCAHGLNHSTGVREMHRDNISFGIKMSYNGNPGLISQYDTNKK
jgi:hypothetical protein